MVRQYVGARYVPKFANPVEWAANTSYEALTIVTFNNASYTSKVPVPPTVGNPADNPDYWALTGNYNAQVEQYRQETENVKINYSKCFNTAANMIADTSLTEGMIVKTLGYNKIADNGGAFYKIYNTKKQNSEHYENLSNGKYALLIPNGYITPQMFGAIGNGNDDTNAIQNAIDYCCTNNGITLFIPSKNYIVTRSLNISASIEIIGECARGKKSGDLRSVDYSIIFNGENYLFTLPNSISYVIIDGVSLKGNGKNMCLYVDSLRNTFKNNYLANFKRVFHLTKTSEIPTYENIIASNYFYNNDVSIYCDYGNGSSTDGYIIDNLFIQGRKSIEATVLSEFIISRNHDYTTHGVSIAQAVDLIVTNNYFDNRENVSFNAYVNGGILFNGNKILTTGGQDSSASFTKVKLLTKPEFPIATGTFTNNIMTDAYGEYNGNVYMLTTDILICLTGNRTNGTAKIISADSNKQNLQGESLNIELWNITGKFVAENNITINKIYATFTNKKVKLYVSFTPKENITSFTQSIFKKGFPAPIEIRNNDINNEAIPIVNRSGECLLFGNSGEALLPKQDLTAGTEYIINCEYYTSDFDAVI